MRNSTDPTTHKAAEAQIVAHLERLLEDGRFMVDTTRGRRAVPGFLLNVQKDDHATDLKRTMSEMNLPDRELQERMPVGQSIEITLQTTKWLVFRKTVGRIKLVCLSPTRKLLAGEEPQPMSAADVRKVIEQHAPSQSEVPTTAVIVSTSGFEMAAHELYERRPGRTIILAEP